MAEMLAAVDCGTNSTRLLVSDGGRRTVERLMRITRLGQGVDATGALAPEAVQRTLEVLREFRQVMDRHGVERVRMTATSAARDAANREEFFTAAADIIGTRPELLTGEEEGRLSFLGATAEDVFRTFATEKRADRIHNPGLEEARADVIVGGTAILVAIMRFFDFDECLVSESDILDGLVLSLAGR